MTKNSYKKTYQEIVRHYERCLEKHGDTAKGVDWPNEQGARLRALVMLELLGDSKNKVSLLDFGCGTSHLKVVMDSCGITHVDYSGLDISEKFIDVASKKFPASKYYCMDLLDSKSMLPEFDYIVLNGVFTEKRELSYDEMLEYFKVLISRVYKHARKGIAFNVMSKHVDWEREDLFHLPFDILGQFLTKEISRNFVVRSEYGLYEYAVFVYREAQAPKLLTGDLK